jgi:hypothetical protein
MVSDPINIANTSPEDAIEITLDVNTRIQILDELSHLAGARKHQFAAFCRAEQCLVVWADEVETLVPSAEALEQRMINFVWSGRHRELESLEAETKVVEDPMEEDAEEEARLKEELSEDMVGAKPGDWEMRDKRPVMLYAPLISGLAMILTFLFIGSGMSECVKGVYADVSGNLVKEALLDGSYIRFALLISSPFGYLLAIVSKTLELG